MENLPSVFDIHFPEENPRLFENIRCPLCNREYDFYFGKVYYCLHCHPQKEILKIFLLAMARYDAGSIRMLRERTAPTMVRLFQNTSVQDLTTFSAHYRMQNIGVTLEDVGVRQTSPECARALIEARLAEPYQGHVLVTLIGKAETRNIEAEFGDLKRQVTTLEAVIKDLKQTQTSLIKGEGKGDKNGRHK
jgi:hypothetical protein